MDGDITFDVNEPKLVSTGMPTSVAAIDPEQPQRETYPESVFRNYEPFNPLTGLLQALISAAAAILGSCAAAWIGHLFLRPSQSVEQTMPDLVAVLVFFLVARLR